MADLSVTIGQDQTELEKGLADAGKTVGKMGGKTENPFQETANKFQSAAGIGGMIAGPVGALVGSFIDAWRFAIDKVIDYVKELIAYATKLRNLSIATGVSVGQLEKMEGVAQASGVSIDTLAHAMNEFNKRMGEARIKGSEVNNLLVKLGVGMDQVADGSFDAVAGMKALAAAHDAGTDAATLAYYGNKMFGSSFEQLLPIIKRGSAAIDEYGVRTWRNTENATYALARLSDEWDNFWHNFKVVMLEAIGALAFYFQTIADLKNMIFLRAVAAVSPTTAGALAEKILSPSLSKEARKMQLDVITAGLDEKDKKFFMDAYEFASGGKGKKLSPFGMSEAGAASQLQQMGGGDIFGAVAFTPLERIATATEKTAENTKPGQADQQIQRPQDTLTK
jgi:hypothetical protein